MYSYPDSPEAVALELMRMIEDAEPKEGRRNNIPERVRLLDLYVECLAAASGTRKELHERLSASLHLLH